MDIVEFLTARLDADARNAERADRERIKKAVYRSLDCFSDDVLFVARHDPSRVLAEVEAKRTIVALLHDNPALIDGASEYYDEVMRALAQSYADHPDFDPAWRVEPATT